MYIYEYNIDTAHPEGIIPWWVGSILQLQQVYIICTINVCLTVLGRCTQKVGSRKSNKTKYNVYMTKCKYVTDEIRWIIKNRSCIKYSTQ